MDQNRSQLIENIFNNFDTLSHMGRFKPEVWLELNLTIVQLKTLFFIDFRGSTNFKCLADALAVTPPSVTGIIDRLVEQGLVSREENPENRRMQILKITTKAKELLANLAETRRVIMISILDQLSLQDLSDLARISDTLTKKKPPLDKPEGGPATN